MLSIFEFTSYREYLRSWINEQGERSHGSKGRMAKAMGISSTMFSLDFKGEKTLTPEQASDLSEYLGLSDLESDYLLLLIEFDRAGTARYQQKLQRKIKNAQEYSRKIGARVRRDRE